MKALKQDILKLIKLVTKDTSGRNESKKIIMIIRLMIIFLIAYFTLNMLICDMTIGNVRFLMAYILFFLLFIGIFVMSYHYRSIVSLWVLNITMIIWIYFTLYNFGWNVGVQHFLMVMLVVGFFAGYNHYRLKMLYAAVLCALRILLYFQFRNGTPVFVLTTGQENVIQIMNTVTIFWCLSAILYICSRNSQELEGKLVEYNNQLERQANTDQLTGLYNRRKAMQYLETLVKKAGENNTGFCICICDIDLFKRVNDTYGHDFGDLVLQSVSSVFLDETKKGIFSARWGGEEFLLVFPSQNGDQAKIILEDIQYKIRNTKVKKGEQETGVTMTFGLAEYDFANGIDATIKDADEKLYLGKTGGRDKIVF